MKIAFLGMGRMGQGMAMRLTEAGRSLIVYNRTREKCEPLKKLGAAVAGQAIEAVSEAEVVCTMLSDDASLKDVMSTEVIRAMPENSVHVSMSTVSVAMASAMAKEHAQLQRAYVACPVFGRPDAAAAGLLQLCFAGSPEHKQRVIPALEPLGKAWDFGTEPFGANAVKLAGNYLLASMLQIMGEAFSLTENNGIPTDRFFNFISSTLFNCPAFKNYGSLIVEEKFDNPGFTASLAAKDMNLVREAARDSSTPMPVAALVQDRMLRLLAVGLADKDWSILAEMQRRDAGKKA